MDDSPNLTEEGQLAEAAGAFAVQAAQLGADPREALELAQQALKAMPV